MDDRSLNGVLDRLDQLERRVSVVETDQTRLGTALALLERTPATARGPGPPRVLTPAHVPAPARGAPAQATLVEITGKLAPHPLPMPEIAPAPVLPAPVGGLLSAPALPAKSAEPPVVVPQPVAQRTQLPPPAPPAPRVELPPQLSSPLMPSAASPGWQLPSFDVLGKSEFWFNKVGIGLLLLGLAFFFKYSIDQNWLTEPVRVILGLILGTGLLGTGFWFRTTRRTFSQVLFGGSVATYYISGYAAYTMFHLIPFEVAFVGMTAVTVLAFILALRFNSVVLSFVAVAGGLGTPFVLPSATQPLIGLVTYTAIVLAGAVGIYLFRGWRSLLWLSYGGGWAVLLAGLLGKTSDSMVITEDRWALAAGALFGLLAYWGVPVAREVLAGRNPRRWPVPSLAQSPDIDRLAVRHVHLLTVGAPLLAFGFARLVVANLLTSEAWGAIVVTGAAVYALVAWGLRREQPVLSYTHSMMAILLFTLGLVQLVHGPALLVSVAIEAAALHFVAHRLHDKGTTIYGHLLAAGAGLGLFATLFRDLASLTRPATQDWAAWLQLDGEVWAAGAAIVLLGAASFVVARPLPILYRNALHLAVMAWLFGRLITFDQGTGWVMLAWAVYAVGLNLAYRRWPQHFTSADSMWPAGVVLAAAGLLFAGRILSASGEIQVVFNLTTLFDALFIALLAAGSFTVRLPALASLYRIAAHAGVLSLIWRELGGLSNGASIVMISWAVYGLIILALCRRMADPLTSLAAHGAFGLALVQFGGFLTARPDGVPGFNIPALAGLAALGLLAGAALFGQPRTGREGPTPDSYPITLDWLWLGIYAALLGWLWHELYTLSNGWGYILLSWAICATGLHYQARRVRSAIAATWIRWGAHGTFLAVAGLLLSRLILLDGGSPLLPVAASSLAAIINAGAISDLATLAVIAGAGWLLQDRRARVLYLLVAHVGLLLWCWRELIDLQTGLALVSIAWGIYAAALLVVGLRGTRNMPVVYAGLSTLALILGKLFLVDMGNVEPIWRVLLFMGFGGLFLVLSYFFQNVVGGHSHAGPKHGFGRFHWPGHPA
jgi:uncharacterized membrane protein